MIPKEVLKNVRRIQIKTGKLVNELFSGQYESVFKGKGIEFEEVREYVPGDDIRHIDWNVTARYGRPFIKKFIEERELTIMMAVDISSSQYFGSYKFKSEISAEIATLLSLAANQNYDKVGLVTFTDKVERYVPPRKGLKHVLRIVREILYPTSSYNTSSRTNISSALEYINKVLKRRAIVFLISDFIDSGYEKILNITNKHHDVICIRIFDPREKEIPNINSFIYLEDEETKEKILINMNDKNFLQKFISIVKKSEEEFHSFMKYAKVDAIEINIANSYVEPLIKFFRMRARRFK
jgi:uncharacterized protein (DUF58 family)